MNIKYIEFKNFQSYGNQLQRIDFSDSSNFYGLDNEEINFIKNYEIEFRVDD